MTIPYRLPNYRWLIKWSSVVGIGLFLIGEVAEYTIRFSSVAVPQWEQTLLIDLMALGVLIAILGPFMFLSIRTK